MSIQDFEQWLAQGSETEDGSLVDNIVRQLLGVMRENECLLRFRACYGIANDSDGAKVVQIGSRTITLQRYKDSDNG